MEVLRRKEEYPSKLFSVRLFSSSNSHLSLVRSVVCGSLGSSVGSSLRGSPLILQRVNENTIQMFVSEKGDSLAGVCVARVCGGSGSQRPARNRPGRRQRRPRRRGSSSGRVVRGGSVFFGSGYLRLVHSKTKRSFGGEEKIKGRDCRGGADTPRGG